MEYRDKIAHGAAKDGIDKQTYETLSAATAEIMTQIAINIMEALQNRTYIRGNEVFASTS